MAKHTSEKATVAQHHAFILLCLAFQLTTPVSHAPPPAPATANGLDLQTPILLSFLFFSSKKSSFPCMMMEKQRREKDRAELAFRLNWQTLAPRAVNASVEWLDLLCRQSRPAFLVKKLKGVASFLSSARCKSSVSKSKMRDAEHEKHTH